MEAKNGTPQVVVTFQISRHFPLPSRIIIGEWVTTKSPTQNHQVSRTESSAFWTSPLEQLLKRPPTRSLWAAGHAEKNWRISWEDEFTTQWVLPPNNPVFFGGESLMHATCFGQRSLEGKTSLWNLTYLTSMVRYKSIIGVHSKVYIMSYTSRILDNSAKWCTRCKTWRCDFF